MLLEIFISAKDSIIPSNQNYVHRHTKNTIIIKYKHILLPSESKSLSDSTGYKT